MESSRKIDVEKYCKLGVMLRNGRLRIDSRVAGTNILFEDTGISFLEFLVPLASVSIRSIVRIF